jgi:murein DD-endopeptidase MepM/ murein hydrolase activator NlpD
MPAQGGPVEASAVEAMSADDFKVALNSLSRQIEDRAQQLEVLETLMMNRNLQDEVLPAGRPIERGWISSFFGLRADPFNGHKVHHAGVDFAGKEGSEVFAVASGVVVWSGERHGYGQMVEINHGNGYATRYGHSKELLVKIGDTVKKGQTIALMGSTGRSTGPHVHFEVLLNGKQVNPASYIQAAR